MKNAIAALVLTGFVSFALAAPASSESIETLLSLTKTKELIENANANIEASIRQGMTTAIGVELNTEQKQLVDTLPRKLVAAMRPEFSWDALKPDFIRLYADSLSQDEVNGLIQFYKSPLGQAMIDKMPRIMNGSIQITQARLAAAMPKIQAAVVTAIAEIKAKQ